MATYYIDTTGVDDAGRNGLTTGTAWATLSYACTRATTAGDIIHVNVGTFTETAQSVLSVGVNIVGEGDTSIINSTYATSGKRSIELISASLENGNQSISYIKLTGSNFTARNGISVQRRSNVTIHHCTIENFIYTGVVFIYPNAENEPNPIYCTGNKFHDNIVTNCSSYIEGSGTYPALGIDGQDGMLVYKNVFTEAKTLGDRGIPIKGVYGINKNVKIYDNEVYMTTYTDGDHWDFAIEMWDYRGGIEIYNNYLEGSIDIGGYNNFASGGTNYSVWIHDNTILQTEQALSEHTRGFIIEGALRNEDIIIERNYIKNTCKGIQMGSLTANAVFKNIRISYNIFESLGLADSKATNSKGHGISWNGDDADVITQTSDNFEVYNNIFTAKVGTYSTMWGLALPACVSTNSKYRNNIVLNFDYAGIYGSDWGKALTCDILSIENNIFYGNGYSNLPRYSGITPTNNTTQNNLIVDPKFVSSSDFSLQDDSPAIDAGIDVGLISDFIGTLVPYGSAPDIGAYEWFEVVYDYQKITLVNTPACYNEDDPSIISRWVATECPINFTLLRRDWYITNSSDVGGFLAISVYGTFSGNDGDVISVYDLTTNSMYTGTITDKSGDPILITDIPYVAGMDIKYLNDHTLYAGYYFEGRLTINGVVESLTVIASPDSFGYADLDVSGILRIKTSIGKVTNYLSLIQKDTNKSGQFTLEYRGCWYGSNEAYISEGSQTSPAEDVIWYYAECVRSEEQGCNLAEYVPTDLNDAPFLNQFDTPVYWYGLPFDLSFILPERPELSPTSDIIVTMKVYNSANVQMGADIVQTIDVDSLEGYVNSLNINSTLIDAGAAYFTVEIFSM